MKVRFTLQKRDGVELDLFIKAEANLTVKELAQKLAPLAKVSSNNVTLAIKRGEQKPQLVDPQSTLGDLQIASGVKGFVVPQSSRPESKVAVLEICSGTKNSGFENKKVGLKAGTTTIGRDPRNEIVVNDPMVSKKHARIYADEETIWLIDEGSANGILVDEKQQSRVNLAEAAAAVLGQTEIRARFISTEYENHAAWKTKPYIRTPFFFPRYDAKEIEIKNIPEDDDKKNFSWQGLVLTFMIPVVLSLVMFFITGSIIAIVFMAFSPLMMLGSWFGQRHLKKKKRIKNQKSFAKYLKKVKKKIAAENKKELKNLFAQTNTASESFEQLQNMGNEKNTNLGAKNLWSKEKSGPGFLKIRLGLGRVKTKTVLKAPADINGFDRHSYAKVKKLLRKHKYLMNAPVMADFCVTPVIGVSGEEHVLGGFIRALITQISYDVSPENLLITAFMSRKWGRFFDALKWLPQVRKAENVFKTEVLTNNTQDAGKLFGLLEEFCNQKKKPQPVLVLVSEEAPLKFSQLLQIAEEAFDGQIYFLWFSETKKSIPSVCKLHIELKNKYFANIIDTKNMRTQECHDIAQFSAQSFTAYCRTVAQYFDAGETKTETVNVPENVSLVDIFGQEMILDPLAVRDRWQENSNNHKTLRTHVGMSAEGPFAIDLRSHGPHALIGGTTGSGKSEFLQTWVLALAAAYSPQRINFLFVDYKGGAAFAECTELPHSVGLVTDLTSHLVTRMLISLKAEIKFREKFLLKHNTKDLVSYEKLNSVDTLPALLIVIDEFATLLEEVPEFIDGVVDVAQRGRSLGVHLILATQRPGGVIRGNLRANTNLRIALRVADEADSVDVIGDKSASSFALLRPGLAAMRAWPNKPVIFQSAYASGFAAATKEGFDLEVSKFEFGAKKILYRNEKVQSGGTENDLKLLVKNINKTKQILGLAAPRKPWLRELKNIYNLNEFSHSYPKKIIFALADIPQQQRQEEIGFDLEKDGHLAIFGGSGSGKSTLLQSLAVAAFLGFKINPCYVYVLDFGFGELQSLDSLPNVGAVFNARDSETAYREGVNRVISFLDQEMKLRSELLLADENTLTKAAKSANPPKLILLIDGIDQFRKKYEAVPGRAQVYEKFLRILREGKNVGIHIVFTVEAAVSFPTNIASVIGKKIVLRMPDENNYVMLGASRAILKADSPPGRCIIGEQECQIAVIAGEANDDTQTVALRKLVENQKSGFFGAGSSLLTKTSDPKIFAPRIKTLIKKLTLQKLPFNIARKPVLGLSETSLLPVTFENNGIFMVIASRSAAHRILGTLAVLNIRAAKASKQVLLSAFQRNITQKEESFLGQQKVWDEEIYGAEKVAKFLSRLSENPKKYSGATFSIANVETIFTPLTEKFLEQLINGVQNNNFFIIAHGEPHVFQQNFGTIGKLKTYQKGISFSFSKHDGELIFKTPFPTVHEADMAKDRCVYVTDGEAQIVQFPTL